MPLYRATISGCKPVLIGGKSATKALDAFVQLSPLKSEEIIAAMEAGEKTFKAGDTIELADPEPGTVQKEPLGDGAGDGDPPRDQNEKVSEKPKAPPATGKPSA